MTWECKNCKRVFENPTMKYDDWEEYYGRPVRRNYMACPYCGSSQYDWLIHCKRCGEDITESQNDMNLCDECIDELWKSFEEFCNLNDVSLSDMLDIAEKKGI